MKHEKCYSFNYVLEGDRAIWYTKSSLSRMADSMAKATAGAKEITLSFASFWIFWISESPEVITRWWERRMPLSEGSSSDRGVVWKRKSTTSNATRQTTPTISANVANMDANYCPGRQAARLWAITGARIMRRRLTYSGKGEYATAFQVQVDRGQTMAVIGKTKNLKTSFPTRELSLFAQ